MPNIFTIKGLMKQTPPKWWKTHLHLTPITYYISFIKIKKKRQKEIKKNPNRKEETLSLFLSFIWFFFITKIASLLSFLLWWRSYRSFLFFFSRAFFAYPLIIDFPLLFIVKCAACAVALSERATLVMQDDPQDGAAWDNSCSYMGQQL